MFCGKCGSSIIKNDSFCAKCGAPADRQNTEARELSSPERILVQPPSLAGMTQKRNAFKIAVIFMSFIIALIALGAVLIFRFGIVPGSPRNATFISSYRYEDIDLTEEENGSEDDDAPVEVDFVNFDISILEDFLIEFRSLFMDNVIGEGVGPPFLIFRDDSSFYADPVTGEVMTHAPYLNDFFVMLDYNLYDFDGSGVPAVVIRWVLPETCSSYHEVYIFENGEYRLLAVFWSLPSFYLSPAGDVIIYELNLGDVRVVKFTDDEVSSIEVLVDWHFPDYHWESLNEHPFTYEMFGGMLTPIVPLSTLQQGIHSNITERLRAEGRLPPFSPEIQTAAFGMPYPGAPLNVNSGNTEAVYYLQATLNYLRLYFPSIREIETVNGTFGAGTRGAVIDFQLRIGLPVTGIVDEATWEAMIINLYAPPNMTDYSFTPAVNAYYITLSNLHLRTGPSTETESLDVVPEGTAVWAIDYLPNERWFRVISHDGQHGYMSAQFLVLDGVLGQ